MFVIVGHEHDDNISTFELKTLQNLSSLIRQGKKPGHNKNILKWRELFFLVKLPTVGQKSAYRMPSRFVTQME